MNIDSLTNAFQIITKILIIFLVLPVHEYAHAWAAHKLGDDTAAYSGRLTINPLAHIDIIGAICLLFTSFGWAKPVPINPIKFKKMRLGTALTAAAGPISNLIFAFAATIVFRILTSLPNTDELYFSTNDSITPFFVVVYIMRFFIHVNVGLAIFNLIPIPPLDGSKILMYFTNARIDKWVYEHQMYINMLFMIIIFTGILNTPISILSQAIIKGMYFITGFIPKIVTALSGA